MSLATAGKTIVRGACPHDCPDICAMLITVDDGRAVEVRGDLDHPFTRGGLCVKADDYIDRVLQSRSRSASLRRTGPKGIGRFEWISTVS